jgi:O-antigen ligase/polysaccharide polymerase Wzy-like membrane protein
MTMDLSLIAGLPALIAVFVCWRRGPESAFLNVYLPALLLLPDDCRMPFSGQFNFNESAIIPIAAFCLFKYSRYWKWSFTDLLVLSFVLLVSTAEFLNTDFAIAQNLTIRLLVTIVMPYAVAKTLINHEAMAISVAKRIVVLSVAVTIISAYEFRMTINPIRTLMSSFFPGLPAQVPSFRYGYARIAGPWTHPILAGVILAVAYRAVRWLDWTHNWSGNVPFLPMSWVRFSEVALLVGCALTISRGPWLAAGVAALIIVVLRARYRTYIAALIIFAIFMASFPIYSGLENYLSASHFGTTDPAEESAAYRREMIGRYLAIAEERPTFGWGQSRSGQGLYPVIDGMVSIDNQYLLLALDFGVLALASMVLILLWVPIRLCRFGLSHSGVEPAASLAVTLFGIFILCAISMSTVYLGAQTEPLLFLIVGWSEALLARRLPVTARVPVRVPEVRYGFERIMV